MTLLKDRVIPVFGVANDRSICWAIAQQIQADGGTPILVSHPNPGIQERAKQLAAKHGMGEVLACDVSKNDDVKAVVAAIQDRHKVIHGFVHGIAYSEKDQLRGRYVDVSRDNFQNTMLISCYSFTEIARVAAPLMMEGGSMLTLTFDASQGPYPYYNVMGVAKAALESSVRYIAADLARDDIRVNAISASPESTISANVVGNRLAIGDYHEALSPMGRRAKLTEIAYMAAFLLGPRSSGTTGEIVRVDCGAGMTKMPIEGNSSLLEQAARRLGRQAPG